MPKIISPQVEFSSLLSQMKAVTPEVFTADGNGFLNLMEGRWQEPGAPREFISPIDGTQLGWLPMLDHATALRAVQAAKKEAADWARVDLDERKRKVQDCLDQLRQHVVRWSRDGGQKKDVYFFCYGNQNQRVVARQTA
ncbi:aldehyde dehydrogenase family protein [Hymenobacter puniceus]|uniref:aldehyde dehydrogenase family protein n=1 Tax=Hymenobacter sp. BT190 TaxID=2763505 RepID=UPI0016516EB6|nr:aldehyde dehydrogenase family protein [Hymenobacter sp. BT190]MBC6700182.1 aldehyde dehydrogenase [Hymenobacter sp. BT190]